MLGNTWLHAFLATIQQWAAFHNPKRHSVRTEITGVSVHWLAPLQPKCYQASGTVDATTHRAPLPLEQWVTTQQWEINIPTMTQTLPVGAQWFVATKRLPVLQSSHVATRILDASHLDTSVRSVPMALPQPANRTYHWTPPVFQKSWRYPLDKALQAFRNTKGRQLTTDFQQAQPKNALPAAKKYPIQRQPIPANRFGLSNRHTFRQALADSADITDASQILLRAVVDRLPTGRYRQLLAQTDGGVSYTLAPGKNEGTEHVVTGRHLATRQNIIAPVSET